MRLLMQVASLIAITLGGCTSPEVQDELRLTDAAVLEVVLKDLVSRDFGTYPGGGTSYVSRDSIGENDFYLGDAQLASDLRDQNIPVGLAESLRNRNRSVVPIWPKGAESPFAKIGNYEQLADLDFRHEDYPDCKLIATFWLPGYAADGTYAMVRFSISPTVHGATGTYLLKRNTDSWSIEWFHASFYM